MSWTCAICGWDANDHDTCMGCGHPKDDDLVLKEDEARPPTGSSGRDG